MAESKTAKKLTQVSKGLAKNLALFVQARVASDLVFLVKERIAGTGIDYKGKQLSYKEGPYKKWRSKKYQVAYKDFMVTGQMWRDIDVIAVKARGNVVELVYGAKTDYSRTLISGHNQRENTNIIKPNQKELNIIKKMIADYCKDYLKAKTRG
jgi:hypothetical protein